MNDRVGGGTDSGKGKNSLLDNNIIPLKMSFTLDGISGIHFGHALTTTHLPQRYKNSVVFQVTNVKHSISNSRWKTTVEAIMRRRPMDMGIYLIGSGEEPRQLGTIGLKNPRHMGNFEIEQTEGDAMPTNEGGDGIKYENLNPEDSSAEPI